METCSKDIESVSGKQGPEVFGPCLCSVGSSLLKGESPDAHWKPDPASSLQDHRSRMEIVFKTAPRGQARPMNQRA